MWGNAARTPVFENVDRHTFERTIQPQNRPAVLKGCVRQWHATQVGTQSPAALCDYLATFSGPTQVQGWYGRAAMRGRFFYSDDIVGRNFETRRLPLSQLLHDILASLAGSNDFPHLFAGAVNLPEHMPALLDALPMDLLDPQEERLTSLWIGNRSRTAAHWDLPQNLACVIAGRRRFTLFPIEQMKNLYIGPIDNKLAGQPISLVDFAAPDFDKFPRFRDAIPTAEVAELDAGDVLYLPSMWIHHVESLQPFGAMINFWWRAGPAYLPTPLFTLMHAFLTMREMPENERRAWRVLFDHYVFEGNDHGHIPAHAQGLLGELTPELRDGLKKFVAMSLGE
jgi:hypothetical protein